MARKAISKKVRFEVFKRDSFTCQYCGKKAPDVVLHVDHIKPVAKGGDNSILNLVTSCQDCNLGKSATQLSDSSAISKQQAQLEAMQAKREQLEMMVEWRSGLQRIKDEEFDLFKNQFLDYTGMTVNDMGKHFIMPEIRKYGISEILECLDISYEQYYNEGTKDSSSNKVLDMIPKIAKVRKSQREKPYLKEIMPLATKIFYKMRHAPKYRGNIISELESFYLRGLRIVTIEQVVNAFNDYYEFLDTMNTILAQKEANNGN